MSTSPSLPSLSTLLHSIGLDPNRHGPSKTHSPFPSPMAITPQDEIARYAYQTTPSTPTFQLDALTITTPSTPSTPSWLDVDKRTSYQVRKQGIQKPTTMRSNLSTSPKVPKANTLAIQSHNDSHVRSTGPVGVLDEEPESKYLTGKWSEEEHNLFLRGLEDYGHQWALIARHYVKTRERSQIASHAQKYFKKIGEK